MKVLDGDLMATSLVQAVFREDARGQKRRRDDFMGTPTPKNRLEARAIGSRLLGEGFAMSTAVNKLLEGFQAVELVGARPARSAPVNPAQPAAGPLSSVASGRAHYSPLQKPADQAQKESKAQEKRKAKKAKAAKEAEEALVVEEEDEGDESGNDGSGSDHNQSGAALLPEQSGMDQEADDEGDREDSDAVQKEQKRCDSLSQSEPVEAGEAEQQPNIPDSDGPETGKKSRKDARAGKGGKGDRVPESSPALTRSKKAVRTSPFDARMMH
jgi:hypothetical protein